MMWLITLILTILVYVIFHYRTRRFRKLTKQARHNMTSLPLLGIAHHFLGNNESRMAALQQIGLEATRAGGVVADWFGPLPYVVISDAEAGEVVLRECLDKDRVMKLLRAVIGHGLIVAPMSVWRVRRRVLSPAFVSRHLRQFVRVFVRQSRVMLDQLRPRIGQGPFPIWNYLAANNMDTVCEAVFGVQMNNQKDPDNVFLRAFNDASSLMAARLCQPWFHSDLTMRLHPRYNTFVAARQQLYHTVDEIIRKNHEEKDNPVEGVRPFLKLLLESSEQQQGVYSDRELREETLTLTIAGTDTSAAAAGFVLLALADHQHVQDKVYHEIIKVIGDSVENCTMEDLKNLEYMEAAIKEAMRLYPPVPVILRRVTHDVTLPSGLVVPRGCNVLMNIWALHRNPRYWGADAACFRPERFQGAPLAHPAQYMPFSYGPRNCPGGRYAMLSMKTALCMLLVRYRVVAAPGGGADNARLSFELMMKDARDFPVCLEPRHPDSSGTTPTPII